MGDAQIVQGEIRKTEDGRDVLVFQVGGQTLAVPVELDEDEDGAPKPIGGCVAEHGVEEDGTPTLKLHVPCLSVVGQSEPPNRGGLTLLEGSGTDG